MSEWTRCEVSPPPEGVVVNTKIDDTNGVRNEQLLKRYGRLYFTPDSSMYVYYTPTHWKPVPIEGANL